MLHSYKMALIPFMEIVKLLLSGKIKTTLMANIETAQPNKKGSFAKAGKRLSTKVDLTPMVDLGFLLITFFVLTSSMTMAKTMTLLEPVEDAPRPVKNSGAMTILLGADHSVFYYFGIFDNSNAGRLRQTDFKNIRKLILDKKKSTNPGDLMYIIKSDKDAGFGDNVNLLDELAICNVPAGHFAEAEITDTEQAAMLQMMPNGMPTK